VKQQDKITAKELYRTEISNMPDREFKVMIIKIVTGLEERVEDFSETLNTLNKEIENIKKNKSEMKNSVNEIKNTLEGINSRLKEAEQIGDMDDRVMENNQAEEEREKK